MSNNDETNDGGLSALTDVLCALASDLENHPLSRSIDDCEAAGRAMRDAAKAIERMAAYLYYDANCPCCMRDDVCIECCTFAADAPHDYERMQMARKALGYNASLSGLPREGD